MYKNINKFVQFLLVFGQKQQLFFSLNWEKVKEENSLVKRKVNKKIFM